MDIKFYGAFVDLHAIDATPARRRGDVGEHPTHGLISAQVNTPTDKTNTYHWTDLAVGGEGIIFNRTLKLVDADPFTRRYYEEQGSSLREKIVDPRVDDPDYLMSLRVTRRLH